MKTDENLQNAVQADEATKVQSDKVKLINDLLMADLSGGVMDVVYRNCWGCELDGIPPSVATSIPTSTT